MIYGNENILYIADSNPDMMIGVLLIITVAVVLIVAVEVKLLLFKIKKLKMAKDCAQETIEKTRFLQKKEGKS